MNSVSASGLPIRTVAISGNTISSMVKSNLIKSTTSRDCDCELHNNNVPCNATHVVYGATCRLCGKEYIGGTARPLRKRLEEHESSVRLGNIASALGEHSVEEHRDTGRGRKGRRDFGTFFKHYDIRVLARSRDALGTFLSESRQIAKYRPELNRMQDNGFIF